MSILLAISILCFFSLLLTAVAIARHVRTRQVPDEPQPDFAQHLFAAAEAQAHTAHSPATKRKGHYGENELEQCGWTNSGQHP